MGEKIKLRVSPHERQQDMYRGLVRIGANARDELGLRSGDYVLIHGTKDTLAVTWPGVKQDDGLGIIRMDNDTRHNCGTKLGDTVTIEKVVLEEAKSVSIVGLNVRLTQGVLRILYKHRLLNRPFRSGDIITLPYMQHLLEFKVKKISHSMAFIGGSTKIEIGTATPEDMRDESYQKITYQDIGGLGDELQKVREMIEIPLRSPELFERLGITPPKGVLLHGPPGTGKTLIAKAVAHESGANFKLINGPEIMSKFYGESEGQLRRIFEEAEKNAPSIIFIDEIDSIAPKRAESTGEVERRVVSQLLTAMDGLAGRGQVIVIGATNRPDDIDEALRRPGRFDREIEIGVPDKNGRKEIFQIHTRGMPLAKDKNAVDIDHLSSITHGFVGADIAALAREAAMNAVRKVIPHMEPETEVPAEMIEELEVTMNDFNTAMASVSPSALRELYVESPNVKWEDVGGLTDVKSRLREAVEAPLRHPEVFSEMGIRSPKGVLLFGPPGTGKTLLAKAVATESEANFISIRGPEIFDKFVGESEKSVRKIFEKARQTAPCVLFFDEIDALVGSRTMNDNTGVQKRIVNQFLAEIDGMKPLSNVMVIGATNRPDIIDNAVLRPGRFDSLVFIPPPDKESREEIFKIHTKDMPLDDSVDIKKLAEITDKYSGADIEGICREAAMNAVRGTWKVSPVKMNHFEEAISTTSPSVGENVIKMYSKMNEHIMKRNPEQNPSYYT